MDTTVVVALISLVGIIISGIISTVVSNSLTKYRISKLEEKVDKHNNLIERTYKIEERIKVLEVKEHEN